MIPPAHLKLKIRQVHDSRYAICKECELHSSRHDTLRLDEHCTECGCPIHAKLKCLSCKCGIDKWEAVLTEDQEEQLMDEYDEKAGSEVEDDSSAGFHRDIDGGP